MASGAIVHAPGAGPEPRDEPAEPSPSQRNAGHKPNWFRQRVNHQTAKHGGCTISYYPHATIEV